MATAGHDRALTVLPHVPLRAQQVWEESIRGVDTEALQRGIEARNKFPLETSSWFQKRTKEALEYCRIPFNKIPFQLPLFDESSGRFFTYRPDFELPRIRINGRTVLLEPRTFSCFSEKEINKFGLVQKIYGGIYYVIIIPDTYPSQVDRKLEQAGDRHAKLAHEMWYLVDDPPEDGEHHPKYLNMKGASREVREALRSNLENLERRDSGPMPLIAPQN